MKSEKFIKLKRRLSIIAILCMVFQIIPVGFLSTNKVLAAAGFRHETVGGDVVLGGNYIEVGISKAGSFGTANIAPAGFHPTNGGVGLRVDGDGFDIGNAPTTGDFFLPGDPEESFTIGYKVGSKDSAATKYTNAERMNQTDVATVTTDTSSGDILSALTSGTTKDNNLTIQQKASFKVYDKFFKNTVTYTNNGSSTLYDVRYMRSFDPDQDYFFHGQYSTYNCVLENFPQDSRAIVRASGGITKEPVFFISTDSRARASTFGFANRDPYDAKAYNVDGSQLKKTESLADQAITLTFALGNLEPGQSTTFEYYTSLDPDYNSGLAAIMGSLGIQINNGSLKTNSLDVSLNLSGKNVAQMQFSNDNSTWSEWESYASTKAWSLTAGVGMKTVYIHFKDSSGNVSNLNASVEYIDTIKPIISVSGNPTTWSNSDVTLSISASDADSGLNTGGAYSFDNGSTWTTSNTKSFSSNGTVNIKVKDNSGNISSQNIVIDKIDNTTPVISSVTQTPATSTNGNVTLTINAGDAMSGLAEKAYSFDGGQTWQESNEKIYDNNTDGIVVKVKDNLVNIATYDKTIKVEIPKKTMIHNDNTDLTVMGIDGTSFKLDVYLVVTPITGENSFVPFSNATKNIENASKYIPELAGKELLALYDVSMFRDNVKIQPDGNVKVKIRIPEELRNRTGLDIVHIADNGIVTSMKATVEGEYLVFTTTHFSDYAIVAKSIPKEMPKTGSAVDFNSLIVFGIIVSLAGIVLIRKQSSKG